jgi:glycosyltransferase involved in cell wall biosynthesis
MQVKNKPILLSICIPTYNRFRFLNSNLLSIFNQVTDDMDIEIIVSNNKSTDDTEAVVQKFLSHPKFKYFEQTENLGATKNILKLVKEYATGEFCWIVGDDDFLLQGALKVIVDLIAEKRGSTVYFYSSVTGIGLDEYNSYKENFDTTLLSYKVDKDHLKYQDIDKFEKLISPDYSIIFLGELMASIFRRSIWLQYDINSDGVNLEKLETTYPHSVILANTFFGKKAVYIETPLLVCLDGAREWLDKLGYILIEQVKNLLDLYEEKGLPKDIMRKCHKSYIQMTFKPFVKFLLNPKSKYGHKIDFLRYFLFIATHPYLLMVYIANVIKARGGGLMKKW